MDELLELLEDIKPTVDFRTCTGPVSYTHLDVYKRQHKMDAGYFSALDSVSIFC